MIVPVTPLHYPVRRISQARDEVISMASFRRLPALAVAGVVAGAALAGATAGSAATAPNRPLPTHDVFYRYDGHTPLKAIKPGTVLKTRTVQVALGTTATPLPATQLLYRTTSELGRPEVTVTTVLASPVATATRHLVGYLSFYDGFGPQCDPSYTLAGGYAGNSTNESEAEEEELLILHYLASGYDVTVPDMEGERRDFGGGHEYGYASLDAIRATESSLHLPASTEVALSGYSGGSIAADWAAELAPRYAPALHLVAVAAGGIPVDYVHNMTYVGGSAEYAGAIPGFLVGVARAFHLDLQRYLSPAGKRAARAARSSCIQSFLSSYPHLTVPKMLKRRYASLAATGRLRRALNRTIMGTVAGHPRVPMFLGIGDQDGTGDGVMIRGDVEALGHEYCRQGVRVQLDTYRGAGHEPAAAEFEPKVSAFLAERFVGVPFTGNCAAIGRGNALRPLRKPSGRPDRG